MTIPDDLHRAARAAGLDMSGLAQQAIAAELDRRDKVAALDAYLAQLDDELGPVSIEDVAGAAAWADRVYGPAPTGLR